MYHMGEQRSKVGEIFTRKVLIPYWFEIVSGIFVGLSMFLIFAKNMSIS